MEREPDRRLAEDDDGLSRWRAPPAGGFECRAWDDECVIYLKADASTHLLDATAGSVFEAMVQADRALTGNEIAARIFGALHAANRGAEHDGDAAGQDEPSDVKNASELKAVLAILAELERIGAARRHTP